jgi:hypothetical protein
MSRESRHLSRMRRRAPLLFEEPSRGLTDRLTDPPVGVDLLLGATPLLLSRPDLTLEADVTHRLYLLKS